MSMLGRRNDPTSQKIKYIKGSFFVVRPDSEKELFWLAIGLEDVSQKDTEVYVRWLNQVQGSELEYELAPSKQSCKIPVDSVLVTTKLAPRDKDEKPVDVENNLSQFYKITKGELNRAKLVAEDDRDSSSDDSDNEEEEVAEKSTSKTSKTPKSPAKSKSASTNGKKGSSKKVESDSSSDESSSSSEDEKPKKKAKKDEKKKSQKEEKKKKETSSKKQKKSKVEESSSSESESESDSSSEEDKKKKKKDAPKKPSTPVKKQSGKDKKQKETPKKSTSGKKKKDESSSDSSGSDYETSDSEVEKPKPAPSPKKKPSAKNTAAADTKKQETKSIAKAATKRKKDEKEESEESEEEETKKKAVKKTKDATGKAKNKAPTKAELKARTKKGTPNPDIAVVESDPTFESTSSTFEFCCYMCTAREAIRAVLTNNMPLLRSLVTRVDCGTLMVHRSADIPKTALDYAISNNNIIAIQIILNDLKNESKKERPPLPSYPEEGTGNHSRYTYGHHVAAYAVSRGNREGKEAFLKDRDSYDQSSIDSVEDQHLAQICLTTPGVNLSTLQELYKFFPQLEDHIHERVHLAVRANNIVLAEQIITKLVERSGFNFNFLHAETLRQGNNLTQFRSVSVTKKPTANANMSPIHCAAANSENPKHLKALLDSVHEPNRPDQQQYKPIHYAAAAQSPANINLLIQKGVDPNESNLHQLTPLMIASQYGRIQNIKAILKASKENNLAMFKNKKNQTALMFAAENNQLGAIRVLHEAEDADSNNVNVQEKTTRYTALMKAAIAGHFDAVKILVEECGADIEKKDKYKRNALMLAVKNGHLRVASYLLHVNSIAKVQDSSKNGLLHFAAAYGWYELVKYLTETFKLELNETNDWKMTPLSVSILKCHFRITQYLNDHGADPNVCDEYGRSTLLQSMAESDKITENTIGNIKYLVERGSSVTHTDKDKDGPLHYLAETTTRYKLKPESYSYWRGYNQKNKSSTIYKTTEEVLAAIDTHVLLYSRAGDLLIGAGADINAVNAKNETPLMCAIRVNNLPMIIYLLTKGASVVGVFQDTKNNILHSLISVYQYYPFKFLDVVNLFVKQPRIGELINQVNKVGKTPIMALLEAYPVTTPAEFSEWTSTITQKDKNKATFIASLKSIFESTKPDFSVIEHFEAVTKDKKEGDANGDVSMDQSVDNDDSDQDMESDNSDYDDSDDSDDDESDHNSSSKQTPKECENRSILHFAVLTKEVAIIQLILTVCKPTVLDPVNAHGDTPLHLAISCGEYSIAIALVDAGASVKLVNKQKRSALHLACCSGKSLHLPLIKSLVAKGSEVNARDEVGNTPLIYVSSNKHLINDEALEGEENPISLLLKNKADPKIVNNKKRTPLHYSINYSTTDSNSSFELEDLLIQYGAPINAVDSLGRTALHYCFIKMGTEKIQDRTVFDPIQTVSALCSLKGIEVDIPDKFGRTPLFYAAQHGSTVSALHLLQRGAQINRVDEDKNSPLSIALICRHPDCAINLIQKKATVTGTLTTFDIEVKYIPIEGEKGDSIVQKETAPKPIQNGRPKAKSHYLQQQQQQQQQRQQHVDQTKYTIEVKKANIQTVGMFYKVVKNNDQGVAYIMLDSGLDSFHALHDSFKADKYRLALTLLGSKVRQLSEVSPTGENQCNLFHFIGIYPSSISNWSERVQSKLLALGLSPNVKDAFGRTPLHYAAANRNVQYTNFLVAQKLDINQADKKGYTPLSLCLIKMKDFTEQDNAPDAELTTILSYKPSLELKFPFDIKSRSDDNSNADVKITPLIFAILTKQLKLVDLLLNNGANVNSADNLGLTPMMHAVRVNSTPIVERLLKGKPDLTARDADKKSIVHHIVNPTDFGSYENVKLLELLAKKGAPVDLEDIGKHTPAYYASLQDSGKMLRALTSLGAKPVAANLVPTRLTSVISNWNVINFHEDVERIIAEQKKLNEANPPKPLKPVVDPTSGLTDTCNVYVEQPSGLIYDVLMTKVDAKAGRWGRNSFYKLQLLHNPSLDTYIVVNRFGRIGETGNYQKTSFPSKDEGVSEFNKIFKSKSGNNFGLFDASNPFVKQAKKYHLLQFDRFDRTKKEILQPFKFEEYPPCKLPQPIQKVMSQFCDVKAIENQVKSLRINTDIMPLGRLSRDVINQAIAILARLRELLDLEKKKEDAERKISHGGDDDDEDGDANNDKEKEDTSGIDLQAISEEQVTLSNQFYELIPHTDFVTEKMKVLDQSNLVAQKMKLLEDLDELEVVSKILLAASHNKTMHPYDYCFNALGVSLETLPKESSEFEALRQYCVNTGAQSSNIVNIFRLQRKDEPERFNAKSRNLENHYLLWHGSKTTNYLSILLQGLKVAPAEAHHTGYMFGKGIYFADLFQKSINYCSSSYTSGDKFLLLSEVALGKMKEYKESEYMEAAQPGFNSTKGIGREGSDFDNSIVLTNGVIIPLDKPIQSKEQDLVLNMNEYIVYDVGQVRMRYLVQVSN